MLISHEHRFIFFHVPKTGGKSVTWALLPHVHLAVDFANPLARRFVRKAVERHRDALCRADRLADVSPDVRRAMLKALRRAALAENALAPHRLDVWYYTAGLRMQLMARPGAFVASLDRTSEYPSARQLSLVHVHGRAESFRPLVPPDMFQGYFKFAFVRDPLTLLRSFYRFLDAIWSSGMPVWKMRLYETLAYRMRGWRGLSFEEFAARSCEGRGSVFEALGLDCSAPQRGLLTDGGGNLLVDFVGKQEDLAKDFATVCERIGLSPELPELNVSPGGREPPSEELRRRVRAAFAGDYEMFDY